MSGQRSFYRVVAEDGTVSTWRAGTGRREQLGSDTITRPEVFGVASGPVGARAELMAWDTESKVVLE